jgi:hypothetical protein
MKGHKGCVEVLLVEGADKEAKQTKDGVSIGDI